MSSLIDIWTYEFARIREKKEERFGISSSDSGSQKQSLSEMFSFSVKKKQEDLSVSGKIDDSVSESTIWMLMNRIAPTWAELNLLFLISFYFIVAEAEWCSLI